MARLSAIAGDYTQSGMIVDRQQITADGGETAFTLTFIEGSEEVYLNGSRLMKGVDQDYVTSTSKITLNTPLTAGDKLLLIGRATSADLPFDRASSESVVLANGQTEVKFSSIGVEALEVYVSGPLVDRGRLVSPQDYEIKENSNDTIILTSTFSAGTIIEGVQGARLAWVDADNLVVNDGTSSKSLSARFSRIVESDEYFKRTNGTQLQDLGPGLILSTWTYPHNSSAPVLDVAGTYPTLRLGNSFWVPDYRGISGDHQAYSWTITGNTMVIDCIEVGTNLESTLIYRRRTSDHGTLFLTSPNGTQFELSVSDSGTLSATAV